MKKTDLVLALDPGKEFYAWAVVRGDGTVIDTGMIKNLVDDFSYLHFGRQVAAYTREIQALLSAHTYFAVVAERFQIRGMSTAGETCEFVNLMLGILTAHARMLPYRVNIDLQPATMWKSWLGRLAYGDAGAVENSPDVFGYPQVTKQTSKRKVRGIFPIKEHQFDAMCLGVWFAARETNSLTNVADLEMIDVVAKASIDKLWASKSEAAAGV